MHSAELLSAESGKKGVQKGGKRYSHLKHNPDLLGDKGGKQKKKKKFRRRPMISRIGKGEEGQGGISMETEKRGKAVPVTLSTGGGETEYRAKRKDETSRVFRQVEVGCLLEGADLWEGGQAEGGCWGFRRGQGFLNEIHSP